MTIDFAHTPAATEQRAAKAKTLARWCYHRGVTAAAVTSADSATRRQLAQRAEVPPPRETQGQLAETWQLVVELLTQRHIWDEAHRADPPAAPIQCLPCLIVSGCQLHRHGRACTACGLPLHRVIIHAGYSTHPSCEPTPAPSDPSGGREAISHAELDTPLY